MGTFHSVFVRFLRGYAGSLAFPSDFTIYDTSESQSLIKTIVKDMGLDEKSLYKPKEVLSRISMAKNNLVMPAAYRQDREQMEADVRRRTPRIADIYSEYMVRCRKCGVMDFDDILVYMNVLFRDNVEAREEIASRFDYILVDEYQDTNRPQPACAGRAAGRRSGPAYRSPWVWLSHRPFGSSGVPCPQCSAALPQDRPGPWSALPDFPQRSGGG